MPDAPSALSMHYSGRAEGPAEGFALEMRHYEVECESLLLTAPHLACGKATEGASPECYLQNDCIPRDGRMPGTGGQFAGMDGTCMLTGDDCTVGGDACLPQARCASREEMESEGYVLPKADTSDRCYEGLFCENGGTCEEVDEQSYHCACPPGWDGLNCNHQQGTAPPPPCAARQVRRTRRGRWRRRRREPPGAFTRGTMTRETTRGVHTTRRRGERAR